MTEESPQPTAPDDGPETNAATAPQPPFMHAHRRSRSRYYYYAAAAAAVLVLGAVLGYWLTHRTVPVHYVTAPAKKGNLAVSVSASGTVNPVTVVEVGTYVSGVIQHLYCDYNTQVKTGQLCAKIDPRPYQSIVDQDQADLAVAKAQLAKDQANLAYTRVTYGRDLGLVKEGIVSQSTLDNDRSAYAQAQAQMQLDRATVASRQAALGTALINLDYTDIVSPVDGTVITRNVSVGQTVAASFQTPTLFLIATDLTKMQVDTNVSESDIGGVKVGDKATFTVLAYPRRPFVGTVVQVRQAPITVQNVVTYDAVIAVDNPDLLLKPGMTATAGIIVASRNDVLQVPDAALRFFPEGLAGAAAPGGASAGGRQARAWVLKDGRPVAVPVVIGLDDGTDAEVVQGDLQPGEPVIVSEIRGTPEIPRQESRGPRFGRF